MGRPPSAYLRQFGNLLNQVRTDAGLTTRQLGRQLNASHSQVVRITSGDHLPRWQHVSAYLIACGVGGGTLQAWLGLWRTMNEVSCELRRASRTDPDRFWSRIEEEWQHGLTAIRRPDPLVPALRKVSTLKELGTQINALAVRAGLTSIRDVERRTGIPKTTVHHWYKGTRKPSPSKLSALATMLDATDAEQEEFARALSRIRITCEAWAPQSGERCMLSEFHRGTHQTADGYQWLDDGELDGVAGPRTRKTQSIGVRGPFW